MGEKDDAEKHYSAVNSALEELKNSAETEDVSDTQFPCVIPSCRGTIIEKRTSRYIGDPASQIIGPGSRSQMTPFVEFYCSRCGVLYHHLPETPRR